MKTKAFTLVEVMVVMAIISILAGMMVPSLWKFWESEEIATTRERMREIKRGLVGDRSLIQNGIRTHFGFVGDNGELPFSNHTSGGLVYLVRKPEGGYPKWAGPYLSGFGSDWSKDAWGKTFRYSLTKDPYDRYVSAELRSAGPNGVFDDGDDVVDPDVQINEMEITAPNRILTYIPAAGSDKSMDIHVTFRDPTINSSGTTDLLSDCVKFTPFQHYTTLPISDKRLPIGGVDITVNRYINDTCSSASPVSSRYKYFINSNMNQINLLNQQ